MRPSLNSGLLVQGLMTPSSPAHTMSWYRRTLETTTVDGLGYGSMRSTTPCGAFLPSDAGITLYGKLEWTSHQ